MADYQSTYTGSQIDAAVGAVSGKADKVSSPTSGNFAALDSNGNLTDSGHKHSDYLTSFTETDPVFTASAAYGITSSDITAWNDKADKISIVSHGTSDTTFTLTPNVFHTWGTVTSLTLTLGTGTSYLDEYMFEFTSGSTATTLSLPNAVSWINGTPTIATNTTYQVSIVNNIAVIGGTA